MILKQIHNISLVLLLICSSCIDTKVDSIFINLEHAESSINYSSIFERVEYINLDAGEECLLSGIKKIYFDSDTLIFQDSKNEGVFVFNLKDHKLVSHINRIGQGPEEYHKDNAIAVDSTSNLIHIYDMMNFKVNVYTYKGEYAYSYKIEYFMRDFAWMDNLLLIMQPCINKVYKRNGVWLYKPIEKQESLLLEHDGDDQSFEFMSTYIEQSENKIYYYDRNDDCIYLINNKSISRLYKIDLKQKVPLDIRTASNQNPKDLNMKSMMFDFVPSPHSVLLCYFMFGEKENPYRYVLINSKTKETIIFKKFINDMDDILFVDNKIFCINDQSWRRLSQQSEDSETVQLQIMYLKDQFVHH